MSREFWMAVRQALLMAVDALERELGIKPSTAQLRRMRKQKSFDEAKDT